MAQSTLVETVSSLQLSRRDLLKVFGVAFLVAQFAKDSTPKKEAERPELDPNHIMECPDCKRGYLDFWFSLYRFLPMQKETQTEEDDRYLERLASHDTYWKLVDLYDDMEVDLTLDERERLVGGLMVIRDQIAKEVRTPITT